MVRAATRDAPEASLVRHGPGAFVGELSLLTGQTTYLTARVVEPGRVHRIPPPQFRRLMAEDAELSDLLLRAFLARRERLSQGPAARGLEIIGSGMDSAALALRTYAARRTLPHVWLDADSVEGRSLMSAASLEATDLPAVLTPERTLVRTGRPASSPSTLASRSGKPAAHRPTSPSSAPGRRGWRRRSTAPRRDSGRPCSMPSDPAARPQAASARIENYVGFPTGLSGETRPACRRAGDEVRGTALKPLRDRRPGDRRRPARRGAPRRDAHHVKGGDHRHRCPLPGAAAAGLGALRRRRDLLRRDRLGGPRVPGPAGDRDRRRELRRAGRAASRPRPPR